MSNCTRQQSIYPAANRGEAKATFDFYAPIHKGLRLALSRLTVRLGAVDAEDPAAVGEMMAALRAQLAISASHLRHEDLVIHEALRQFAPGAVEDLERDHAHHRQSFAELETLVAQVEATGDRVASLRTLYLAFSRFVADDFAHMAHEETEVLPVLQALFTDAELMAMEHQILASIAPDMKAQTLALIFPALRPAERLAMALGARQSIPPEVFAGFCALAFAALAPADAEGLAEGLNMNLAKAA